MARGKSIARAEQLQALYEAKAADLRPTIIHHDLKVSERSAALEALRQRQSRIVVCVDMLGAGFDLPHLKIAAVHDPKQSLGPMLQFIGRFSRTAADENIGTASVFVARDPAMALSPLRDLLREDPDWNLLLSDITDRATETVEELNTFEESFADVPDEVPVSLLKPKMSARAHIANTDTWTPDNAVALYGEDSLIGNSVSVGANQSIAWFIVTHNQEVRWGDLPHLEQLTFELVVMYFDRARRLLYIYGSDNRGSYQELADAVLGEGASMPIRGLDTFRVLSGVDRLIPTNVGLLDIRDHFNRFSMHVGSDVVEALNVADRQNKTQHTSLQRASKRARRPQSARRCQARSGHYDPRRTLCRGLPGATGREPSCSITPSSSMRSWMASSSQPISRTGQRRSCSALSGLGRSSVV